MKGKKGRIADWSLENYYGRETGAWVAGADECGRGAWAGNMVGCAAVYHPQATVDIPLRDSKAYTLEEREEIVAKLTKDFIDKKLLFIAYAEVEPVIIESSNLNKLNAELFVTALRKLPKFDWVLLDGTIPITEFPGACAPKADEVSITVATASLFGKVYHDRAMKELHKQYPNYGFNEHVGYGTKAHVAALQKYGVIKGVHRNNFLQNLRNSGQIA